VIEAAVPGFDPCDVEVCVEPRRVTIAGRRGLGDGEGGVAEGQSRMHRSVELPEEVERCDVIATVVDGVVELTLRKVAASESTPLD